MSELKLSERLKIAAKIHADLGGHGAIAAVIREAAQLARRVEEAPVGRVPKAKVGDLLLFPVSHDLAGQRVRLVREA